MEKERLSKIRKETRERDVNHLLSKLSFYSKGTGVVMVLFGIFQTTVGLMEFGIGSIIGILLLLAGISIFRVGKDAKQFRMEREEDNLIEIFRHLVRYLRYQCLLVLSAFILAVIAIVWIVHFLSDWEWAIRLVEYGKNVDAIIEKVMGFLHRSDFKAPNVTTDYAY